MNDMRRVLLLCVYGSVGACEPVCKRHDCTYVCLLPLCSACVFVQNPFYELEMPIRCELFTLYLEELIERHSNAGGMPGGGGVGGGKKTAQY